MKMLDRGTAQIDWLLSGQVAMFRVSINMTTVLQMNLLTGRVTDLK